MPSAVIFDVDGTLVDSVDLHAKSWQETFAEFGYHFDFDAIRSQIGKGGDKLMPVFLSEEELDRDGEKLEARRAELLKQKYLGQVKAFPCVRELFERLIKDGKRVALASSAKKDELETYKRITQIGDLVEVNTTSDDAEESKPEPDIFRAALQQLKDVAPHEAIVVGDTPYDAEAAAKTGVQTVGLLCGGFAEADLRKAGCVAIYRDPADLLARYEGSPLSENGN